MPAAWIDHTWISYRPRQTGAQPSITFQGWTLSGTHFTAFLDITDTLRFDVIKAQLDAPSVWVEWSASTREVYRIVALKHY